MTTSTVPPKTFLNHNMGLLISDIHFEYGPGHTHEATILAGEIKQKLPAYYRRIAKFKCGKRADICTGLYHYLEDRLSVVQHTNQSK